ncbi:MAG TPA: hypothetical protein PLW95_07635, partial [bacterium]|nr:hypothetical protein [bacterium]
FLCLLRFLYVFISLSPLIYLLPAGEKERQSPLIFTFSPAGRRNSILFLPLPFFFLPSPLWGEGKGEGEFHLPFICFLTLPSL